MTKAETRLSAFMDKSNCHAIYHTPMVVDFTGLFQPLPLLNRTIWLELSQQMINLRHDSPKMKIVVNCLNNIQCDRELVKKRPPVQV
jgi:hypothetical protein